MASLKISFSCSRTFTFLLSRPSSSSSSVESPSRSPSSMCCCFLQLLKVCSETSSSRGSEPGLLGGAHEAHALLPEVLGIGGLVGCTRSNSFPRVFIPQPSGVHQTVSSPLSPTWVGLANRGWIRGRGVRSHAPSSRCYLLGGLRQCDLTRSPRLKRQRIGEPSQGDRN